MVPQDFLTKVQKAIELQEHLTKAEVQQLEDRKKKEQKQTLKREQLQKLHELEEIRTQLHKLETPEVSTLRPQHTNQMPPRDPGLIAKIYRHAKEPCDPMDGPRGDQRFVRYLQVCNLTGVSRTKNSPTSCTPSSRAEIFSATTTKSIYSEDRLFHLLSSFAAYIIRRLISLSVYFFVIRLLL
ncbi:hypothetical protein TSAR_001648 [Trichomalopsis sarcophagae]|uniref:Uncharacterized protein n=1 Tax=Trichomalopsis sarcophagae TaxID=543379 RepID=A0A232EDR7_9HYME|nr:hypothetical protein TSAR_001648 [Trichomalopsis sarcophagae]